MVNDSEGRVAALLDSAAPGTSGPAPSPVHRQFQVSEGSEIVRIPHCESPIELRVPRKAVRARKRPPQQHIEGFNADATPC
jgi:hypothetical protein